MLRKKSFLQRTFRHPLRLQEFVRVLVKYGLSDWIKGLKLDRIFPFVRTMPGWTPEKPPSEERRWALIRMAFEELGPTFIKLGQIASNRSDVLPMSLIKELTLLQDDVQPFSFHEVRRIVKEEFDQNLDEVFAEFDQKPHASASIAQVHRARLRDGTAVAVKIQRPGIRDLITTDTEIIMYLAGLVQRYFPRSRLFNPVALVEEFKKTIMRELDFSVELQNLERFKELYGTMEKLYVPTPYKSHSTKRILTMEYIRGAHVAEVEQDESGKFDGKAVARTGANIILEQIFAHGFFHADPHPGNILVLDNNVVCFLDFGIMGRIRPQQREFLVQLVLGTVNRDPARVTDALLGLTKQTKRDIDVESLEEDIYDLIESYVDVALGEIDLTRFFTDMIGVIVRHGLKIPSNLMLVTKTLVAIEGIGADLSPDFDLMEVFEPFARRLVLRRFRPRNLVHEGYELAQDYGDFLKSFPVDAKESLQLLKTGKLRIGFRVGGLEPLRRTLDAISYRLVFGLVLASLLVSSSLVIQANVPPLWNEVSVIGLVGFAIAGVIAFGFFVSLIVQRLKSR